MNNRKRLTWIFAVGGVLVILGLVLSVCMPNYVGSPRSKTLAIVSNLRQLDGAVQQWALDHGQTGAVVVTEEDLAPYLRHPLKPVAGERYVVRTLAESPEACLSHKVELCPAGSVLRLSTNGDFEVVSPNKTKVAKHKRAQS